MLAPVTSIGTRGSVLDVIHTVRLDVSQLSLHQATPHLSAEAIMNLLPNAVALPATEILIDGGPGNAEVMWQQPPRTAGSQQREDCVDHLPYVSSSGAVHRTLLPAAWAGSGATGVPSDPLCHSLHNRRLPRRESVFNPLWHTLRLRLFALMVATHQ